VTDVATVTLAELPAPVADYAQRFAGECAMNGLGPVLANEMFSRDVLGKADVNGDSKPDYLAYACMFGCAGAPFAFVNLGMPCPSGVLLLSADAGYLTLNLPGTVNKVVEGEPLRIVTTRRRFSKDDCTEGLACEYVYELKEGRFQRVGLCPPDGCASLLR
jgi:hypothetical protein